MLVIWSEYKKDIESDFEALLRGLGHQKDGLLGEILETKGKDMVRHYEGHIKKLKMKRDLLSA